MAATAAPTAVLGLAPVTAPSPPPAPKAGGLKKVSFGGIAKKKEETMTA
jgi:hypothetical protein